MQIDRVGVYSWREMAKAELTGRAIAVLRKRTAPTAEELAARPPGSRIESGITQEELAARLHRGHTTVSRVERGSGPRPKNLARYLDAMHADWDDLMAAVAEAAGEPPPLRGDADPSIVEDLADYFGKSERMRGYARMAVSMGPQARANLVEAISQAAALAVEQHVQMLVGQPRPSRPTSNGAIVSDHPNKS